MIKNKFYIGQKFLCEVESYQATIVSIEEDLVTELVDGGKSITYTVSREFEDRAHGDYIDLTEKDIEGYLKGSYWYDIDDSKLKNIKKFIDKLKIGDEFVLYYSEKTYKHYRLIDIKEDPKVFKMYALDGGFDSETEESFIHTLVLCKDYKLIK